MKKIFLFFISILVLLPSFVKAETLDVDWKVRLGGEISDIFADVIEVEDGYVAVGYFDKTDIGHNIDGYIAKFSKDGKLIWDNTWGGDSYEYMYSIVAVNDGYVIFGRSHSNDFGGMDIGYVDGVVVKFDKNGNFLWNKNFGGSNLEYIQDALPTEDGGFLVSGTTFSYEINGIRLNGLENGIIYKLDKNGDLEKFVTFSEGGDVEFNDMSYTSDGGLIVTGLFSGNLTNATNKGLDDGLVVKYDKDLNVEWYVTQGGAGYDRFCDVIETEDGNYIVVADFQGDVGNVISNGSYDAGIVKIDKNGKILFTKLIGGASQERINNIAKTRDGGYIICGYFYSMNGIDVDFYTGDNATMVKFNKNDEIEWVEAFQYGNSFHYVLEDSEGNLVGVGSTNREYMDNWDAHGYSDAFIVKYLTYFDLIEKDTTNGTYKVEKDRNDIVVNITPDERYLINKVLINDEEVEFVKNEDGTLSYTLKQDSTIEVIFVKDHLITLNTGANGTATAEKINADKGRVNAVPNEGYELDEIIIKDTTGKEVVYEEKDGYYYFDINDDLVITVTFKELPKEVVKYEEEDKEEENPKTADAFIYYASSVVCSLFGIWSVEQYRKNKKEIN